jgi:hypothetical protein
MLFYFIVNVPQHTMTIYRLPPILSFFHGRAFERLDCDFRMKVLKMLELFLWNFIS